MENASDEDWRDWPVDTANVAGKADLAPRARPSEFVYLSRGGPAVCDVAMRWDDIAQVMVSWTTLESMPQLGSEIVTVRGEKMWVLTPYNNLIEMLRIARDEHIARLKA